jgi:hypothetical protein
MSRDLKNLRKFQAQEKIIPPAFLEFCLNVRIWGQPSSLRDHKAEQSRAQAALPGLLTSALRLAMVHAAIQRRNLKRIAE